MKDINRRNFLKLSGLSMMPVLPALQFNEPGIPPPPLPEKERVYFIFDGPTYRPTEYIAKLQEINTATPIKRDSYGSGGDVEALCKKMAALTGKESAIYMPTGTMANQLAIAVLSGENTKVFVQDTSHVYRDEADAAQSVFNKRLVPLAKDKTWFTLEELENGIAYLNQSEVFRSGIGAVSIENPVRRTDGGIVPIEEIRKIAAYCRKNGYPLHLDGARIYLAAAFSGVSIAEYSSHFDTVYISLYKYLGAAGGAVLCGPKSVIGKMEHLVKVHGGTMYTSWGNAAMALHHMEGLEQRLKETAQRARDLFAALNKLPGIKISPVKDGSNIFEMRLPDTVDDKKFTQAMLDKHNILMNQRNNGIIKLIINETLLRKDVNTIVEAFRSSI